MSFPQLFVSLFLAGSVNELRGLQNLAHPLSLKFLLVKNENPPNQSTEGYKVGGGLSASCSCELHECSLHDHRVAEKMIHLKDLFKEGRSESQRLKNDPAIRY